MSFELPLTQEILADSLGLSIVHINRTLQTLRREQLIEQKSSIITLKDKVRLAALAEYAGPKIVLSRRRG